MVRSPDRRFSQMSIFPGEASFLSGSSRAHMWIAWMCIEAADLCIRLYSSRGLSPVS